VLTYDDFAELLAESEIEDFIPSDEDIGDPLFEVALNYNIDSDSDQTIVSSVESITNNTSNAKNRRLGQGKSRRGRGKRSVQLSNNSSYSASTSPTTSPTASWASKTFQTREFAVTEPSYLPNFTEEFNKIYFFEQYVDKKLVDLIVQCTNRTSIEQNGCSLNVTAHEVYIYIGITFIMAEINYPRIRMYWETKWRVPTIADNMSRNKFIKLRNVLKIVFDGDISNESRKKDKLWRVRPLIEQIQKGCRLQVKDQCLSLDDDPFC
jgi:hypothetical protein